MAVGWVLWDASGLVKRYLPELGSNTVDAVFDEVTPTQMAATPWGYLEVHSILRRRYNAGVYDRSAFIDAITVLQSEVVTSGDFGLIPITDAAVFAAVSLIDRHNINSADAAILSSLLRFRAVLPVGGPSCLLVDADQRLLRAASSEGFQILNPEQMLASDVAAFLSSL